MKSAIVAALCMASAIRTSGQAQEVQKQEAQNVPVAVTWDYDAQAKTLIVHALNNSGKDIVGYMVTVRHRLPDGTLEKEGWSGSISDRLFTLVSIQMAKDPIAEERTQRESGYVPFTPGTTRDITMYGINSPDVNAAVEVVFYVDGTFDERDERAFKRILVRRQGQLLEMKKANEIMRAALVDTTNDHPIAAVITGLAKAATEGMVHDPDGPYDTESAQVSLLRADIMNVRNMQQSSLPPQQGKTERERLTEYVEDREKRVELMTPHCHLEISLKQ